MLYFSLDARVADFQVLERFLSFRGEGGPQGAITMLNPGKNRLHGIVFSLLNRIKLVIMTARTAHGQAKECAAGGMNHVVQLVLSLSQGKRDIRALDDVKGSCHQEAGCGVGSQNVSS